MSEGVFDSMLSKGTSIAVSSGCSEEGSGRAPSGDRLIAPAPRFKTHKVSTAWDFLPGCGKEVAQITRPNEQARNDCP
ncbi:hypothetical protein J1N35_005341 [Gossypium stocksii]|uniref:Uncharacterized protein n=1 Tax=Gossypium stocksii TaxID=47602 RepID=A0A9D4AJ65_9ROSI|nr:hypothetical protein J1N35_005341 [Gossypium stocksii]